MNLQCLNFKRKYKRAKINLQYYILRVKKVSFRCNPAHLSLRIILIISKSSILNAETNPCIQVDFFSKNDRIFAENLNILPIYHKPTR